MCQTKIKVGFFQFKPVFGKKEKNLQTVIKALRQVKADLIVLPELPFTGYYFKDRNEVENLAEDITKSAIVDSLTQLCKKQDTNIVTGFAEKYKNKLFNSALLIGTKGVLHTYRKLHLFNLEKYWFDPGDTPLSVQEIKGAKIGMMICWDWIYPEVTRKLAVLGADIVCHPSNLVLPYCQYTMVSRCMENNIFSITANRIGSDKREHGEIIFTGKSQIVAPRGEVIRKAKTHQPELFITTLNTEDARKKNITDHNHIFNDRRPQYY